VKENFGLKTQEKLKWFAATKINAHKCWRKRSGFYAL